MGRGGGTALVNFFLFNFASENVKSRVNFFYFLPQKRALEADFLETHRLKIVFKDSVGEFFLYYK